MSVVQVLLAEKGVDAVSVTALGALRSLLGFGDTLRSLERWSLFELRGTDDAAAVVRGLESYLQRTFEFWNPNKERCWIRTGDGALEVIPSQAPKRTPVPGSGADHLLLWLRPDDDTASGTGREVGGPTDTVPPPTASEGFPRDFPAEFGGGRVVGRRGEAYSFFWSDEPGDGERLARIERAGAVRSRGEGLLVQPQYQLYRVLLRTLPWPLWEDGTPGDDVES